MSKPAGWSVRRRTIVSLIVALHVSAVFVPPFMFATTSGPGNSSPFAAAWMRSLRPYVDALFLNHGYFFFAPNPGPSYLVRYTAEFDDGRPAIVGRFPDRLEQRPRLLYHRHFMLSEQWNARFVSTVPPREVANDPRLLEDWKKRRAQFEAQRDAFCRHLAAELGASRVKIVRIEHRPAAVYEVILEGKRLNDPSYFRELSDDEPAGEEL